MPRAKSPCSSNRFSRGYCPAGKASDHSASDPPAHRGREARRPHGSRRRHYPRRCPGMSPDTDRRVRRLRAQPSSACAAIRRGARRLPENGAPGSRFHACPHSEVIAVRPAQCLRAAAVASSQRPEPRIDRLHKCRTPRTTRPRRRRPGRP